MSELAYTATRTEALARWLDSTLRGTLGGAVRIESAGEDASARRYHRAHAARGTYVVMDAPPERVDSRPYLTLSRRLRALGLNVPVVHAADLEQGFLLLDDLGSRHYLETLDEDNADALYGDALEALAVLQARAAASDLPPYDGARLLAEMRLFSEWFIERHLGLALEPETSAALEGAYAALAAAALEQPVVFVHRDFHSRNLMVCPGANPGILDFQDALAGPLAYDVVSLLRDVYLRWAPERVAGWLERYRLLAHRHGVPGTGCARRLARWFDLLGVQRHLKVCGLFARLHHRDGKPRYLEHLPRTLGYLAEVTPRHPETEPLAAFLDANRGFAERLAMAGVPSTSSQTTAGACG